MKKVKFKARVTLEIEGFRDIGVTLDELIPNQIWEAKSKTDLCSIDSIKLKSIQVQD